MNMANITNAQILQYLRSLPAEERAALNKNSTRSKILAAKLAGDTARLRALAATANANGWGELAEDALKGL